MVVAAGERFAGSVSGGCVENEVIVNATEVIETGRPRRVRFGVSNETAWAQGLPCGGDISILIVPLDRDMALPVLDRIAEARATRALLDLIVDENTGAISTRPGDAGSQIRRVVSTLAGNSSAVVLHLRPPPLVIVVGATHIAQHLVPMLGLVGFETILVDPRSAYLAAERFGAPVATINAWPREALQAIGLDSQTAVVAISHVADIDDEALGTAIAADCFYVGALGSARNHARRVERLAATGADEARLARIKAPIGLDIGASGPAEIAASIVAEIILALRGAKRATATAAAADGSAGS